MHLFGGREASGRACERLETLRWAVAADQINMMPLEFFTEHEIEYEEGKYRLSGNHWNYLFFWSPEIWQPQAYDPENALPWIPGALCRFPTWNESESEVDDNSSEDEDGASNDMEVDG